MRSMPRWVRGWRLRMAIRETRPVRGRNELDRFVCMKACWLV
jgi:hypothetical protein